MASGQIPSVPKRLMGNRLRELREAADLTIEDVAGRLEKSRSAAYRHETGETAVSRAELEAYARLYKVEGTPAEENLYALLSGGRRNQWRMKYKDVTSQPQADIADLESMASSLRYYDPMPITGLIQCDAYVDALFQPEADRIKELGLDLRRQIEFRNQRCQILHREDRPEISIVFSESALAYQVGGAQTMREQASHMVNLIEEGLDIRILPFSAGFISRMSRSLILATVGVDAGSTSVVYLEGAPTGELIDEQDLAAKYERRFALLQEASLTPAESADLLRRYTW